MAEVIHRYVGLGTKEQSKAGQQLVQERIKQTATKRQQNELELAIARAQLIDKTLVQKQAAFLLVNLRQKILNLSSTYSRQLIKLTDVNQMHQALREISISLLNEIKDLPNSVTDPDWLRKLEKKEVNGD